MIKISVIIPVYNMGRYLKECLESVFNQTLREIEVICIDDGSTDHSSEILAEYSLKYDNISVIHQENQGSGVARNKGIELAKGKYICFMDPDDFYAHEFALQRLYIAAEENDALICGGNMSLLYENGEKKLLESHFYEDREILFKEYGNYYSYTRFIFNTKMIREQHILFPSYRRYQDPPFFLKAMTRAQKFYTVNEMVYIYRVGHKKVNYPLTTAIDVLRGIKECFEMACKHELIITYDRHLKNILLEHLKMFYKYALQDEEAIWELINEINRISMEWTGEYEKIFCNRKSLEDFIFNMKNERERLIAKCHVAENVIIYGAGEVGKYILKNYEKECKNIIGFAVTKKTNNAEYIDGYEVKEINEFLEYRSDALVIVAVGKKNADEIVSMLKEYKFENICYVEYGTLLMLEELV
ncbi:MAG: glycosyltransferase [Lachnospiraceae bacterium]|nr:glycosyltransferase [Lachnospiraceae bacterium]